MTAKAISTAIFRLRFPGGGEETTSLDVIDVMRTRFVVVFAQAKQGNVGMSAKKRARFEAVDGNDVTSSAINNSSSLSSSSSQPSQSNHGQSIAVSQSVRMDAFREVAQRRAEHFARGEKTDDSALSSVPSTTPTGRLRKVKVAKPTTQGNVCSGGDNEEENGVENEVVAKEEWPGPWSTARNILAQRDKAKKAREETANRLKNAGNYVDMGDNEAEKQNSLDAYDIAVAGLAGWKPVRSSAGQAGVMKFIPKLSTFCINVLSKYVEYYDSLEHIAMHTELLDLLADQVGKERRLNLMTCERLAVAGSTSLYLPDCGAIDEDVLIKAVETVNGVHLVEMQDEIVVTEDVGIPPLRRLVLKSCGRCFTDKVAAAIYNHTHALEELVLTGCYRLSDEGLKKLLESCVSSLKQLDISCNNRLQTVGLSAIAQMPHLTSLTLDYVHQLTDEHLLSCLQLFSDANNSSSNTFPLPCLPHLEEMSLIGCHNIGDESLVPFLNIYGANLCTLRVSSLKIADETVMAIRNNCRRLQTLWMLNLAEVTAEALIGLFLVHNVTNNSSSSNNSDSINNASGTSAFLSSSSLVKKPQDGLGPLQNVNFQGGVSLFDDAVIQLMQHYGRSLQVLTIDSCSQLSNRAAAAIWLHGSWCLKRLSMSFVRHFSEAAVASIIDRCVNLELLHIWGCTQITSALLNEHHRNNINLQIVGNFSQA